jgi:hypothetical protein
MQALMSKVGTPDGQFHDGNPATGELGTIVSALWLNALQSAIRSVQSELLSVLAEAGIAADPEAGDQLVAAIRAISFPLFHNLGNGADLNSVTASGFYMQPSNLDAQSGANYPSAVAGKLEVFQSDVMVYQSYHTYLNGSIYYRTRYNGTWYPWKRIAETDSTSLTGSPTAPTAAFHLRTNQLATMLSLRSALDDCLRKDLTGTANVILTDAEAAYETMYLYGALVADTVVVVPTGTHKMVVSNATSGSFKLVVRTAAGSGVAIPQGRSLLLRCDGASVVDALSGKASIGESVGGSSQAIQDVTASRAIGVAYTNTGPLPILVNVALTSTAMNQTCLLIINGTSFVGSSFPAANLSIAGLFIVPPGATYQLPAGNYVLGKWLEIR